MIALLASAVVVSGYLTAVWYAAMFASTPVPWRTYEEILAELPGWQESEWTPPWEEARPVTGTWRPDPDLAAARRVSARLAVRELLGVA